MINEEKVSTAVKMLLEAIGEDTNREGLLETPERVARMYFEIFAGYNQDPATILNKTFETTEQDLVLVKSIPFHSHCEHHMVPFFGTVSIAYIPNGRVVGISKLARLVDCYTKRLQIQERLTAQIANSIEDCLKPFGVAVIVEAEHMCMTMRGVRKPGAKTVTSSIRGIFKLDEKARNELMHLMGR